MPAARRRFLQAIAFAAIACAGLQPMHPQLARADEARASGDGFRPLVAGVWVSGQISPADMARLQAQGIKSIVAVRPDGEEAGQPSFAAIEAAARSAGLRFSYAPITGKTVPQAAVDAVGRELARPGNTVLVYCRTGRRATRAWALAEASRADGLEAVAIESVAESAGHSLGDLHDEIAARVATRAAVDGRR
jgi:uncharacterized protein (TIGR01244 family)